MSQSVIAKQFDHVNWNITSKSTKTVAGIFVALAIITAAGAVATYGFHSAIGSNFMLFGGGLGFVSLVATVGLVVRDQNEKKTLEKAWDENKDKIKDDCSPIVDPMAAEDKLNRNITLNGKQYVLELIKGGSDITINNK